MAKISKRNGFDIIKVSREERRKLGWGDICDLTGVTVYGDMYYLPALGRKCLSGECFKDFIEKINRIPDEDKYYQDLEKRCMLRFFRVCGVELVGEEEDV